MAGRADGRIDGWMHCMNGNISRTRTLTTSPAVWFLSVSANKTDLCLQPDVYPGYVRITYRPPFHIMAENMLLIPPCLSASNRVFLNISPGVT